MHSLALIVFPLLIGATAAMAQQQGMSSGDNPTIDKSTSDASRTPPPRASDRTGSHARRTDTDAKGQPGRERDDSPPKSGDRATGTPDGGPGTPTAH